MDGHYGFRCLRALWADAIQVAIYQPRTDGKVGIVTNMVVHVMEVDGAAAEPSLTLRRNDAQQLMDELWHCGLRPSEGSGSAGSLAATERHLKDMQSVAFGLLRKTGIEVK